jgi:hypothetical protein
MLARMPGYGWLLLAHLLVVVCLLGADIGRLVGRGETDLKNAWSVMHDRHR